MVDQYSPILFVAIIGILFLFAIDTISKLFLLNHGAYATNPIMAYLLNTGPYAFFTPKYAVTILATACLYMFRGVVIRKLNVGAHSFFYLAAWVYVTVVAWELYLGYDVI
jgi:hypothetical protein